MIWAQRVIVVAALIYVAVFTALQALLRYGFNTSVQSAEELSLLAAVWLYFIGMSYATAVDGHVGGGIDFKFLERDFWRVTMTFVRRVVCAVVAIMFTYYGWRLFQSILDHDFRSVSLALPKVFWVASFLVGSVLTAAFLVVQLTHAFRDVLRR